jgi:hypothetical protein
MEAMLGSLRSSHGVWVLGRIVPSPRLDHFSRTMKSAKGSGNMKAVFGSASSWKKERNCIMNYVGIMHRPPFNQTSTGFRQAESPRALNVGSWLGGEKFV